MKKKLATILLIIMAITSVGCTKAETVSHNLSKAADSFEIQRRVVFFNGITGEYMLTITGLCSITDEGNQLEVTCKVGEDQYKKHFLGLSDNVSYFVEQTDAEYADAFHYRVIFRPETIVPDVDLQTSK